MEGLVEGQKVVKIRLKRNKWVIVDEADFDKVRNDIWTYDPKNYAMRNLYKPNKIIYMHRVLLEPIPDGFDVDHINGDGLDNRRSNIRACEHWKNLCNQNKKSSGCTSKYKGVSFRSDHYREKPWEVTLGSSHIEKHERMVGCYKTEIEAVLAYNEAAKKFYGEFARLNEVPSV